MAQIQYVLVAAGAVEERIDGRGLWRAAVEPGHLIFVKPSSQAYWRGAPVPVVQPLQPGAVAAPPGTTLLGVLARMPVVAGSNFGVPLAVLTIIVQGPAELRSDATLPLELDAVKSARWHACGGRHIFHSGKESPAERCIVVR